jgi:tetratricopeptide (TPR) repeat protein
MTLVAEPNGPGRVWVPIDLGIEEPDIDDEEEVEPTRPRKRIRKRRLLALPIAIGLLGVGGKLVSMSWFAHDGAAAYDDERYGESESAFDRLRTLNVVAPWRAWMNIGDARFRQRDLTGAEQAFARALEENPDRCDVRFNLAVTIEAQGDRLMGDNVRDVTDTEELDGLARYRVALDIVNAATCRMDSTDSPGFRLANTRERLEEKLGADDRGQDEAPMDDDDDDDEASGEETDENQTLQDQLEERNQSGEEERQDAGDINPAAEQQPREPNW